MHKPCPLARCATAAIAAALALGSTPLLAQDAAPPDAVVVLPPVTAAPAPNPPPVMVVPPPAPVTDIPQPAVAPVVAAPSPAPRASAAPKSAASRAAPAKPVLTMAHAPAPASKASASAPVSAQVAAIPNPSQSVAPSVNASDESAALESQFPPDGARGQAPVDVDMVGIVAALALLLFGLFALLFWSSRRSVPWRGAPRKVGPKDRAGTSPPELRPVAKAPPLQSEPVAAPVVPITTGFPARDPNIQHPSGPAVVRTEASLAPLRPDFSKSRGAGGLPSNGASVDLPAKLPDSFEERDRLLKRMIAAAPDKANPFRLRKARLRRARLILQSLGRKFEHVDPWIDLSQYPNNWPELAQRKYRNVA